MLETAGAFVLGIGILLIFINVFISRRRGRIAGRNPWNADTLEWATDSPPEAYAFVHLPTVASRHPLWDDHDEEADPSDERTLDDGRLTLVSTWLDAEPYAVASMPKETLVPLLACLTLFGFFLALVFQLMWLVLGCFLVTLSFAFYWLWPRPEAEEGA